MGISIASFSHCVRLSGMKAFAALLVFALSLAGSSVQTTATILQGGPSQDMALTEAALFHNIEEAKDALKKGANPSAAAATVRRTPPLGAAAMGTWRRTDRAAADLARNETARKLSQQGLSDEEINRYLAVEITRTLFAAGAKLGPYDREILFQPIADGNMALVSLLLDRGASVTGDLEGYSPTELAKKYDQEAVYKLLVSRGGIPVDSRSSAQLALVEAAQNGDVEGMQRAVKNGALINDFDTNKNTALMAAVRWGTYDPNRALAILWLLDHRADPNLEATEGLPLHIFVFANKYTLNDLEKSPDRKVLAEQTLAGLFKAGAKVSGMDIAGQTLLP